MTTSSEPSACSRVEPAKLIRPRRKINGVSAVLLPFSEGGRWIMRGSNGMSFEPLRPGWFLR